MIVKICGVQTAGDAEVALAAGADLIGMIMVPGRTRTVTIKNAQEIANVIKRRRASEKVTRKDSSDPLTGLYEDLAVGPRLVGVFQNQSLEEISDVLRDVDLDFVQLHGSEPNDLPSKIAVPTIRRLTPGDHTFKEWPLASQHSLILVDGATGGTGEQVDWDAVASIATQGAQVILAGGLTPENVHVASKIPGVIGVDVSGGVETGGVKDLNKIRSFISNAKLGTI